MKKITMLFITLLAHAVTSYGITADDLHDEQKVDRFIEYVLIYVDRHLDNTNLQALTWDRLTNFDPVLRRINQPEPSEHPPITWHALTFGKPDFEFSPKIVSQPCRLLPRCVVPLQTTIQKN